MNLKSTWYWSVVGAGACVTGTVAANDPRDAVSRALTSSTSEGAMVGDRCGIPASVIDNVPANGALIYEYAGDGCYLVVRNERHTPDGRTMTELKALWSLLGEVPVSGTSDKFNDGAIETKFLHFEPGTSTEAIWHWFEEQNSAFVVGDVLQGIWPEL